MYKNNEQNVAKLCWSMECFEGQVRPKQQIRTGVFLAILAYIKKKRKTNCSDKHNETHFWKEKRLQLDVSYIMFQHTSSEVINR